MPDGTTNTDPTNPNAPLSVPTDKKAGDRFSLLDAPALALSNEDIRHIVLDYLSESTYVDSAVAFAKEWQREHASSSSSRPTSSSRSANGIGPDYGLSGHTTGSLEDDEDAVMELANSTIRPQGQLPDETFDSSYAYHRGRRASDYANGSDESPILSQSEINVMRTRKEIKRLVQQGSIQAAMDLCNAHFPSVLAPPSTLTSTTPTTHRTPTSSRYSASSTPRASGRLSSKPSSASLAQSALSFNGNTATTPVTVPLLLSLSLQIQLFIEIVRSSSNSGQPSSSRPSTPFSSAQSPGSANGSMEGSTSSLTSSMSYSTNGSTASTSMLSTALSHIQSLHAQAVHLKDSTLRTVYLKELESVSGLLPYHDPKLSPVAYYLDESRRVDLAEAINGAILLSLGYTSSSSKLLHCVRQNEVVWKTLSELHMTLPPAKAKPPKPIQPFDLQDFLDTQSIPGA